MQVVGEWVTSADQLRRLRVLGCSGSIGGQQNRTTSFLVDEDIRCGPQSRSELLEQVVTHLLLGFTLGAARKPAPALIDQ